MTTTSPATISPFSSASMAPCSRSKTFADPAEVLQGKVDVRLVGDRHEVEHCVGRPAERHDDGDRVLERLPGHDLPSGEALAQQVHHGLTRLAGEAVAPPVGA